MVVFQSQRLVNALVLACACFITSAEQTRADDIERLRPSNFVEFMEVLQCADRTGARTDVSFDTNAPTLFDQLFRAFGESCLGETANLNNAISKALPQNIEKQRDLQEWMEFNIWHALLRSLRQGPLAPTQQPRQKFEATDADNAQGVANYDSSAQLYIDVEGRPRPGVDVALRQLSGSHLIHINLKGLATHFDSVSWGPSTLHFDPKIEVSCNNRPRRTGCEISVESLEYRDVGTAFSLFTEPNKGLRACTHLSDPDDSEDYYRAVSLVVDGTAIPLNLSTGCSDILDNSWKARFVTAQAIVASVQFTDSIHTKYAVSDGKGLAAAFLIAEKAIPTPDPEIALNRASSVSPKSLIEILKATQSWRAAASCYANLPNPEVNCARQLINLHWDWLETISISHPRYEFISGSNLETNEIRSAISADEALKDQDFLPVIDILKATAKQSRYLPMRDGPWTAEFGTNERSVLIDQQPASSGFSDNQLYAYALSNQKADAVILRSVGLERNITTISLSCSTSEGQCVISVPFQGEKGRIEIHTAGNAWQSKICVKDFAFESDNYALVPSYRPSTHRLNATGCLNPNYSGTLLHSLSGSLSLVEGGPGNYQERAYVKMTGIDTAMDLAHFLVRRLAKE